MHENSKSEIEALKEMKESIERMQKDVIGNQQASVDVSGALA
jgi:hypothetical protein